MAITVNRAQGFVEFCTDLALRSEWETAQAALVEAKKGGTDMLVGPGAEEAATVRELEQRMGDSILLFKIEGLPRKRWQELGVEHPARDDNAADATFNVNTSTFFDAVAAESILAVNEKTSSNVVDFDPKTDWTPLADEMTDGQYNEFVEKFLELNRGKGSNVPFSRLASVVTQASEKK